MGKILFLTHEKFKYKKIQILKNEVNNKLYK